MNQPSHTPNAETSQRLLTNLRRTRLEMKEFNLELEEMIAQLDQELCQQKLKRVRLKLSALDVNN
ncbi:MAG: hypothetical protein AB4058_00980 [Microcystaceae cyanobacterium]